MRIKKRLILSYGSPNPLFVKLTATVRPSKKSNTSLYENHMKCVAGEGNWRLPPSPALDQKQKRMYSVNSKAG